MYPGTQRHACLLQSGFARFLEGIANGIALGVSLGFVRSEQCAMRGLGLSPGSVYFFLFSASAPRRGSAFTAREGSFKKGAASGSKQESGRPGGR